MMFHKENDFQRKVCKMKFIYSIRLERHFKVAHPIKHDGLDRNDIEIIEPAY